MYYFLSLLMGILVAIMVALNGELSAAHGLWTSAVIIHIVATVVIGIILIVKRDKLKTGKLPFYMFTGGFCGAIATVCSNMAFGKISVSALLALSLTAQTVGSILVDSFGWFKMPRYKFRKQKILSLALTACGIVAMLGEFDIFAVSCALISGFCLLINRIVNAGLASATNNRVSTFYNNSTGLISSLMLFLLFAGGEKGFANFTFSNEIYIYLGGAIGAATVIMSNCVTRKIPAFYVTLLLFIGQVFTGIGIDVVISGVFSARNLIGGLFVAIGMAANVIIDNKYRVKNAN